MSRNSNGQYTLPAAVNPVVTGTTIESDWANTTLSDVASAITTSISSNGVTTPTANLPMGGYKHTGVGNASARNHYLAMGQGQDLSYCLIDAVAGTNNLTGTMPGWVTGTPAAYPDHFMFAWEQPAVNTGAVTFNINGLGAKSVLSRSGGALVAGDLPTGGYNIAFYDGTNIVMLTDTTSTAENGTQQTATTGWMRPAGGSYTLCTEESSTTVGIPAGSGRINIVGDLGVVTTDYVEWDAQTITLTYVASALSSVLFIDSNGAVVQYATTAPSSAYRSYIHIADVEHPNGAIEYIFTNPVIYGDDAYLYRDSLQILGNILVSGGKITGGGTSPAADALHLDLSAGILFAPSVVPNTALAPNLLPIDGQTSLQFYTLSGIADLDYLSATTVQVSPVTLYNPGAADAAATALTNATDATIHRLYFRNNIFYWVFGQTSYTSFANAVANYIIDRSNFQLHPDLSDAILMCEIIATKDAVDYTDSTKTAIISNSGRNYLFGSATSISDAPNNANTYGRSGGAWVTVIDSTSPTINTDATITGTEPKLILDFNAAPTDFAGVQVVSSSSFDYGSIEFNEDDDKLYVRSRNPADGVLRYTWTYNLANGATTLPGAVTMGAVTCGAITSSGDGTFSGTGAVQLSAGTTAQRPGSPGSGMIRYNATTGEFEGYGASAWGNIGGGASGGGMFYENNQTISVDTTLTADRNSMTAGPITIADGVTVTIPDGANWVIV